jgi:MFS family permease
VTDADERSSPAELPLRPGDVLEQAKAIGVFAFVASAGGAIGLLVGGVLTQAINWHWIFFVNLPIGVGTAVLARQAPKRLGDDVGVSATGRIRAVRV